MHWWSRTAQDLDSFWSGHATWIPQPFYSPNKAAAMPAIVKPRIGWPLTILWNSLGNGSPLSRPIDMASLAAVS